MAVRNPTSAALLEFVMELAGVGAMMLIAGASDDAGTMMIIIMFGFWLIFLISAQGGGGKIGAGMVKALSALALNPSNTPGNNSGSNGIFF